MPPLGFGSLTGSRSFGRGWQVVGATGFQGIYIGSATNSSPIPNFISSTPTWSSNAMVGAYPAKSVGYATNGSTEYYLTAWVGNSGHSVYAAVVSVSPSGGISIGGGGTLWSPGSSWTVADLDVAYNHASGRILCTWSAYYSYGAFRSRLEYRDIYGAMWTVNESTGDVTAENIGSSIYRMYSGGYAYGYHECNGCNPYNTDSSVMDHGIDNDDDTGRFRIRGYNVAGYVQNNLGTNLFGTTDLYPNAYRRSVATGVNGTNNNLVVGTTNTSTTNQQAFIPESYDGNDAGHKIYTDISMTAYGSNDIGRAGPSKYLWLRRNQLGLINYDGTTTATGVTGITLTEGTPTYWNALDVRPATYSGTSGSWAAFINGNSADATNSKLYWGEYTSSSVTQTGTSTSVATGGCSWASPAWSFSANGTQPAQLLVTGRDYATGYLELHAYY